MSEVFDPEKVQRFEGDALHAAMESGSVNVMVTSYVRTADYLKLLALYREARGLLAMEQQPTPNGYLDALNQAAKKTP